MIREASVGDGAAVSLRIGVPDDPYVDREDLETVFVEIFGGERALAAVATTLGPEDVDAAVRLADELVEGIESGRTPLDAGSIEQAVLGA